MKTPLLCLFQILALVATNAPAATKTWDGSSSVNWGTSGNWTTNIAPIAADDLVFPAGGANKGTNNNLASGLAFKTISFAESGYSISGVAFAVTATATLTNAIMANHSTGTVTINVPVSLSTNTCTIGSVSGGTLVFSATSGINLGGENLNLNDTGNTTFTGPITGAGAASGNALTKASSGTLTLSANNTYTGTTSFASGVVILNGSLSGGGAVVIQDNATLQGNNGTITGPVSMNGMLDPGGTAGTGRGKLTFSGATTFSSSASDTRTINFDLTAVATTPGTSYDQIVCGGTVTAGTAKVVLDPGTAVPAVGTEFILISKTSAGAISGTFHDAADAVISQSAIRSAGLVTVQFSYTGGDGNDFSATVVPAPLSTATRQWDDSSADHLFSTALNWTSAFVPAAGNTLVFGNLAPLADRTLVKNDSGGHFFAMQFTDTGYSINPESLTNNDVTLSAGLSATATSTAGNSWNCDLHLGQAQTFSNFGTGTLTLTATLSLDGQDLTLHCDNVTAGADPVLRLSGLTEGTGRIIKTGTDRVEFSGAGFTNWGHTGELAVQQGELRITRTIGLAPALVVQGPVTIGGAGFVASLTTTQPERILDTQIVTVNASGTFAPGASETIGSLTLGGGTVGSTGAGKVIVDGDITITENGTISGALENKGTAVARQWDVAATKTLTVDAALTRNGTPTVRKTGAGTLLFTGTGGPGTLSVEDGTLTLNGAITSGVNLGTATSATLDGTGTAEGISVTSGTISPGGSAIGTLTSTKSFTGGASGTYLVNADATTCDRVVTETTVGSPGNAQLVVTLSAVPQPGTVFTILEHTGGGSGPATRFKQGAVTLNQGSVVTSPQGSFTISYNGGTGGNDVTLTAILPASTGITKVWNGTGANNNWSNAANWTGGIAPVAGDSLEFPATAARLANTNDLPVNMAFNRISYTGVTPNSNGVTISGNALRLLQSLEFGWTGPGSFLGFDPPLTLDATAATVHNTGTRTLALGGSLTAKGDSVAFNGDGTATQRSITLSKALTMPAAGQLLVRNNASLTFSGVDANAFGTTTVEFGKVTTGGAVKIPGALILGDGTNVVTSIINSGTMSPGFPVTVNANATFLSNANTISNLTMNGGSLNLTGMLTVQGSVLVNSGSLTTSNGFTFPTATAHNVTVAAGASLSTGTLNGGGLFPNHVNKLGGGTWLITASVAGAPFIGVSEGTLQMDALDGTATVCFLQGGTVSGSGKWSSINGVSGAVSPGASPAILATNVLDLNPGLTLNMEIGGTQPGVHHDQVSVSGTADLENAPLITTLTGGYTPLTGQVFRLLDVTSPNPISGTFSGVPQGGTRSLGGGVTVQFNYTGGDGNDLTATVTASPAGAFRVWDGGGADANWMTAANWTGDIAPLPGEALRFPNGAAQLTNTNNFPANTAFNGLKIEANYTLNGNSVTLNGDVDAQPPGPAVLALPLRLDTSRAIILSGAGSLTRSGITELAAAATLTLRNNSSGETNVTGRIQPVAGVTTDGGVVLDGSGTGLVKLNVTNGNTYTGETWVKRGVLEVTGVSSTEVPGNLRIGGAGFTASVDNPGGATVGRIRDTADLILEAGGTHNLTGATPIEKIARLIMRGGSLVQPSGGQLIALDRIHAEGSTASTITTPVFFESSGAADIDLFHIEAGSSLTLATNAGFLFGGAANPKLRKDGPGTLIIQGTLTAAELDCWEGTVVLSGAASQVSGTTIVNGGTVTGNGSLSGAVNGAAANSPAGSNSPGGGTIAPSSAAGTGSGLLTCGGNLLPVTATHLAFEVGGTTAVTQHDQLQVNGTALDLNRCVLDLSLINGFVPTAGQAFTLINKISGGSPTPRPFAGKDEGVTFTAAAHLWKLTYAGGDGNDVVLTAQGPAPTLTVATFAITTPPGGAAGKQFTATITGPASTLVNLEASGDLQIWTIIGSASTSGAGSATFNVTDSAAGDRRFYKFSIP